MRSVRLIPCLDVTGGRVVKGVRFVDLTDEGDPVELAARYDAEGADEITFLDITASSDERETMVSVVASGGVSGTEDLAALARLETSGRRLAGAIVGKAIVEGRFSVEEGLAACVASA